MSLTDNAMVYNLLQKSDIIIYTILSIQSRNNCIQQFKLRHYTQIYMNNFITFSKILLHYLLFNEVEKLWIKKQCFRLMDIIEKCISVSIMK